MIENIQKESEARNRRIEEQVKRDKVSKSIRELDDYLPILQEHVRGKQTLDNKAFINPSDLNNIERIQKKLSGVFDKFKNDEAVQTDIDLIVESFSKILK